MLLCLLVLLLVHCSYSKNLDFPNSSVCVNNLDFELVGSAFSLNQSSVAGTYHGSVFEPLVLTV